MGLLGARPVEEVVEHAREFVRALSGITPATSTADSLGSGSDRPTVVDIGTGGGIPGLVVANDRPDLSVTLVDRRQKCTDFLERAVAALGFRDRVTVRCCDVSTLIGAGEQFDAVTARGFGPPSRTVDTASKLVRPGGLIVISEPPEGDRWIAEQVGQLGLTHHREGSVTVFNRVV